MNSIIDLSPQQLRQAAELRERILILQEELQSILGDDFKPGTQGGESHRRLSARGLANIRAGARKRWAKFHQEHPAARKGRSTMSAAGRASIAARMKQRWAAAKAAGRTTL